MTNANKVKHHKIKNTGKRRQWSDHLWLPSIIKDDTEKKRISNCRIVKITSLNYIEQFRYGHMILLCEVKIKRFGISSVTVKN